MAARSKATKQAGRPPLYGKLTAPTAQERAQRAAEVLAAQKPKTLLDQLKAWLRKACE